MAHFQTEREPLGRFVGDDVYELHEDLLYFSDVPNGETLYGIVGAICVPAGTKTDFASIPRAFWRILPPWDKHRRAAILHDHIYAKQFVKREVADRVFLEAMELLEVSWWKRRMMYRAVRMFGWAAWNKHKKQKEAVEA